MEMNKIGEVGVDSGSVFIGDPCYVIHQDKLPESLGESWSDFCDKYRKDLPVSLPNGLGVWSLTRYGDGLYPVYELLDEDGRITGLYVDFTDHPLKEIIDGIKGLSE
tara:strand:+ start:37 stop:357 length:321 start_codon:yes stop_codon:yes gene_type:complete